MYPEDDCLEVTDPDGDDDGLDRMLAITDEEWDAAADAMEEPWPG